MDDGVPDRFKPMITAIVARVAQGDFNGLTRDFARHADDDRHDLGMWVRDYPATVVPLPEEAWRYASAEYSPSVTSGP